jgi:hypothetical protein
VFGTSVWVCAGDRTPYLTGRYATPPSPVSKLARYRTLSPLAGVCVSPVQLGAMSIADKWSDLGMRSMDKESSFKLLDTYFDLGVGQSYISCADLT